MTKEKTILFEVRDHIAYVTFNRPERFNACRHMEYDLLADTFKECDERDDVRAVILTGKGSAFTVADDLAGFKVEGYKARGEPLLETWANKTWADWVAKGEPIYPFAEMAHAMLKSSKIYIAAVNGLCYLAEMLYPMDFVIAAEGAMISNPDLVINQAPCGGATQILPRLLGRRRALEVLLDPEPFTAEEAYRRGIVNKVVPLADLMPTAEALARKLTAYNPKTIGIIKKLITASQGSMDEGLKLEQLYCGFSHGLPGAGVPVGNWIELLGYPIELLQGVDTSTSYGHETSKP
jgi:enoyl-CoA hydratase/carnithine racemase